MLERFKGERGSQLLLEEMCRQRLVSGVPELAEALVDAGELIRVEKGETIIEQGGIDNDLYFIVVGEFSVVVNDRRVTMRSRGDQVGEMAAVTPFQPRAATVTADSEAVVVKVGEAALASVADRYPEVWRRIAQELARRLEQRNALIRPANEKPRVFLFSSSEALPIARAIENALANDPFLTVVWANGVFKVTNYTLETLEDELMQSDFAVAVAHPDDKTEVSGTRNGRLRGTTLYSNLASSWEVSAASALS